METRFRGHDLSPQFHSDKRHIILENLAQLPLYVVFFTSGNHCCSIYNDTHTHTAVTPRPLTDIIQLTRTRVSKTKQRKAPLTEPDR